MVSDNVKPTAANHLLTRMMSSLQHPPKILGEIGMDNLDVQTIDQIQDHDQPSIQRKQR